MNEWTIEWMKSYIAHVSSRSLFRALNIESNSARPVIIQIPTQSPGRYTAELPLRRIKLIFIPRKFTLCAKYSNIVNFLGHPSNYGPGPVLLNFSDRADTDELTPYSLYEMHFWFYVYRYISITKLFFNRRLLIDTFAITCMTSKWPKIKAMFFLFLE